MKADRIGRNSCKSTAFNTHFNFCPVSLINVDNLGRAVEKRGEMVVFIGARDSEIYQY
jgi:hypothetical protein